MKAGGRQTSGGGCKCLPRLPGDAGEKACCWCVAPMRWLRLGLPGGALSDRFFLLRVRGTLSLDPLGRPRRFIPCANARPQMDIRRELVRVDIFAGDFCPGVPGRRVPGFKKLRAILSYEPCTARVPLPGLANTPPMCRILAAIINAL